MPVNAQQQAQVLEQLRQTRASIQELAEEAGLWGRDTVHTGRMTHAQKAAQVLDTAIQTLVDNP